mmetsp:Transcript_40185/g.89160  ORF Transcript_40185/g.89160 Transcript_40185/m.89160 type:complete len:154 (-) Transcript_40185:913-1374(-)|eukprot:CAMPEP_0202901462 /NCGR_PEP_ID=MMETSP1392-20130828/14267_1 /ASSEMBLY_ACC=CAM_ASM_000868 /TAXON_ID=225041 /ORGANISM="Chlamydomonas chlamydogama, Strain SAG 11-48b" /LENGTH=153 /DNA_ID=CAMNT_0049588023 /DNA_START=66 /DNA_END=527 /DNA_ORIENTATION=+
MALSGGILFDDIFEVVRQDPDGKKFDKVSRYQCKSDLFECDMTLDVNIDVYPLQLNSKYQVALASTLYLDGTPSSSKYDATFPGLSGKPSLMDKYEYVMYGKIFKYKDNSQSGQVRVEVYISFGGLLMQLVGDPKKLQDLEVDSSVYLLMRKV